MAIEKSKNKVKQTEATPNPRREEVKVIGFSAEESQNIIEPDLNPIRRNSSNQIISYTLPKNKLKESSATQYGNVLIPAVKSQLNKIQFNRVMDNDIEQFTRTIDDIDIEVKSINSVSFPELELDQIEDETPLAFNGELVRIGTTPSTIFYIEEGKFYTFQQGHLWHIVAERLGKPMGFRIGDDFDYTSDKNKPGGAEIDRGMNQYSLYNDNTYKRRTIAYLETNKYGGALTRQKILGEDGNDNVVYLPFHSEVGENAFESMQVGGADSTLVQYWRHKGRKIREMFTSVNTELKVLFQKLDTEGDERQLRFKIFYKDGRMEVVEPSWVNETIWNGDIRKAYKIPGSFITSDINKIIIQDFVKYKPFMQQGTPNEKRWALTGTPGGGAVLYKFNSSADEWQIDSGNSAVPYSILGQDYFWNGSYYEEYIPPLGTALIDYQMMDGNLIALYGSDSDMRGGDELVDDLWEAAQDTLAKLNIIRGYQNKKSYNTWFDKIGNRSSSNDETKLKDVLTQTAQDILDGGTGYLSGNPFKNANLPETGTNSNVTLNYYDLTANLELLISKNSLINTGNNGVRRDLEQAWEKGDGSATFGGSYVSNSEKSDNKANVNRTVNTWKACIEKRSSGREEKDLLRLLGHTARAKIRSGNGRII